MWLHSRRINVQLPKVCAPYIEEICCIALQKLYKACDTNDDGILNEVCICSGISFQCFCVRSTSISSDSIVVPGCVNASKCRGSS